MKYKRKTISAILCAILLSAQFLLPCFASDVVLGDADSDGTVSAADARLILRVAVGFEKAAVNINTVADLDGDKVISASDARLALIISTCSSAPQTAPADSAYAITGFTQKGYPIYEINGCTYIDGILIANKTYSLPESYNPGDIRTECLDAFSVMKNDAAKQGLSIYISSGFRSYASQKSIYNRYVSRDGRILADTYSARPGHSEHQTGYSIDLNTITQAFGRTSEGKWVAEHCHEYGFIIRYPQGKSDITGYCYEPWHLRYVGIEAATKIAQSGLCLEEYYGITSAYN